MSIRRKWRVVDVGWALCVLFQLPWCALDGQALAGLSLSLSQTGTWLLSGPGQTRGTSPNHTSLLSQIRTSPQHTGPQTGLMNSLNDRARAGTMKKLSEVADKLTGG